MIVSRRKIGSGRTWLNRCTHLLDAAPKPRPIDRTCGRITGPVNAVASEAVHDALVAAGERARTVQP